MMLLAVIFIIFLFEGSSVLWANDPNYQPEILYSDHVASNHVALSTPVDVFAFDGVVDITFTVKAYRSVNDLFSFNTRVFCYDEDCSVPGPTLHLKPGETLSITIINELGVDSPLVSKDIFQSPNHTNVEVFGIRFDPLAASTLVAGTRVLNDGSSVGSGQTATYVGTVSSDHAPGTHWYHSNVPGSSALHVMGGLFGAIVVDPAPSYIPSLLSIISLKQTQIVFSHIMLEEDPDVEMGKMLSEVELLATPWSVTQLSTAAGSALYINPTYNTSTNVTIRDAWFTNGQYQPAVEAASGESQVFDIVAASGDRILELEIRSSILSNAPTNQCSMVLLALDGVYLTSSRVVTHLPLLQGSRAAVVVRCITAGQYYLMSVSEADPRSPYYPIGTLESKSVQVLISLKIKGAAATASGQTFYLGSIPRPSYLQNFMNIDPVITAKQIWSISTAQAGCCGALSSPVSLNCNPLFWLGIGSDCTLPCLSHTACSLLYGTSYTDTSFPSVLNGMCEYNNNSTRNVVTTNQSNRTFADSSDVVQEISLWGLSSYPIPINLHGTHFQIIGYDNTNLDTHYNGANELDTAPDLSLLYGQVGDYRDTWPAIAGKSVLRARVVRQDGVTRISMSTTFLKYADRGMKADVALTFAPPSKAPVINPGTNSSTGNSNSTVPNGPGPPVQNTSNPVPIVDAFSLALDGSIAAAAADQSAAQMEYLRLKNTVLPSNLFPLKGHQTVVKFVGNQSLAIITEQLPGQPPDIELLPASEEDFFISSLVLDQDSNRIYFATQYGIFGVQDRGSGVPDTEDPVVPIITGLLSVTIVGFNLDIDKTKGSLPESSVSITVKGHPCTSLRVVDNQPSSSGIILPSYVTTLNCLVYSLGSNSTIDPSEVIATVLEGMGVSTSGSQSDIQPFVSIEYLDAIKAGSGGRPSLLSVEILALPFSPQALFFLKSSDSNSRAPKYLYWINKDILTGSGTVYRCLLTGERIETVFESEQQTPGAVFVSSVPLSDLLIATSTDRAFELLDALSITASGGRNTTRETAAEATTLFTDIIFFTRSTVSQDGTPSVLSYAVVTPLDPTEALYSNKGSLNRNSTRPALISISKTVAVYLPQSAASTTSVPTALSVDRSLTNGYLFMSFLDGTVLRLDVAYVLAQPLLLALHPRSSSATNYGSTSWVRRVSNPRITSRLSALYSIPTNASSPHGQRVFNLDSNMRSLIISSDNGYSSTAIDLLSTGILWPSSITGPAVMDTNSSSQTVYLAEALGKIWRVELSGSRSDAAVFDSNVLTSRVIADMSSFPSSVRIRDLLLQTPPQDSSSRSNQITFETVY